MKGDIKLEEFYLKIYLFRANRVPPIKIARNSQLRITIETMDYTVPVGATASAFAKGAFSDKVYTQSCTVDGNRISFIPEPGFFVQGRNVLQYEINDGVIPLAIDVNCEISLPDGGQAAEPEQVLPLVQRAENAAKAAEGDAAEAETSARKAAASLENVLEKEQSAVNAAGSAAQSLIGANAAASEAQRYSAEAKDFANTAAGYAGAATVSIGWDADGYFSIFEQEE